MSSTRDHLIVIARGSERVREAVTAMYRASVRSADEDEREAFLLVQGYLLPVARAIDTLPAELIRVEVGLPWRELSRLPSLLSRPDFLADAKVIRRTLDVPMRELKKAALRLVTYLPVYEAEKASETQESAGGG
jgi:hypothetical protein